MYISVGVAHFRKLGMKEKAVDDSPVSCERVLVIISLTKKGKQM